MNKQEQLNIIKKDFIDSQKVLLAIGDETRQAILLVLMETECQTGLRVGEITKQTHLSRPSGITSPKDFTRSRYYFNAKRRYKKLLLY